ncbi:hypothetical protein A2U01_0079968, partial [Trifolium medium]|nr:hypothetical protein [Trifolium medium]
MSSLKSVLGWLKGEEIGGSVLFLLNTGCSSSVSSL